MPKKGNHSELIIFGRMNSEIFPNKISHLTRNKFGHAAGSNKKING